MLWSEQSNVDLDVAEHSKQEGRILRFRPRGSNSVRPLPPPSPVEDLGKYEGQDVPDDYRHRMKMNFAGLAATIVIVVVGIWLANTMVQIRKNEECMLSGRRGCIPLDVSAQPK